MGAERGAGQRGQRSALVRRFGEGAQLLGVDVPQLLQLSLSSAEQILDVHHVRLLDAGVLTELVADPRDEARFVPAGPQEVPVQDQDLLLQLAVARHRTEPSRSQRREARGQVQHVRGDPERTTALHFLSSLWRFWASLSWDR